MVDNTVWVDIFGAFLNVSPHASDAQPRGGTTRVSRDKMRQTDIQTQHSESENKT